MGVPRVPSSIWMRFSTINHPAIEVSPFLETHWGSNTFRTQRSVFGFPTAVLWILTSDPPSDFHELGQHNCHIWRKFWGYKPTKLCWKLGVPQICPESPQPFTYLYLLLSIYIFYNSQVFQFIWVNGWKSTIYGCFPQSKPPFSRFFPPLILGGPYLHPISCKISINAEMDSGSLSRCRPKTALVSG